VFETIVRNAVSLCGSLFANVFRFDGELLHFAASHNVGPRLRGNAPGEVSNAARCRSIGNILTPSGSWKIAMRKLE
jgi:hypothetical protein